MTTPVSDDTIFAMINSIISHPNIDATSFKASAHDAAGFTMGVCTADTYTDFNGDLKPWSRPLQIGRIMQLFYDAPSPVGIAMALATMDKLSMSPHERDNLIKGYAHVMTDYSYRIFKEAVTEGIECHTTRTYALVKHILNLGEVYRILTTPYMSMEVSSVQHDIGSANMALMLMCNEDVDAHPMSRVILQRYIDEIKLILAGGVKDAA